METSDLGLLKLTKLEPDNIHTQLKLGELYIKAGQMGAAKQALLQTSSHYEESGMVLKAMAVYNQVIQIDPIDPEIRLLLANAYKRIGLANDAAFSQSKLKGPATSITKLKRSNSCSNWTRTISQRVCLIQKTG